MIKTIRTSTIGWTTILALTVACAPETSKQTIEKRGTQNPVADKQAPQELQKALPAPAKSMSKINLFSVLMQELEVEFRLLHFSQKDVKEGVTAPKITEADKLYSALSTLFGKDNKTKLQKLLDATSVTEDEKSVDAVVDLAKSLSLSDEQVDSIQKRLTTLLADKDAITNKVKELETVKTQLLSKLTDTRAQANSLYRLSRSKSSTIDDLCIAIQNTMTNVTGVQTTATNFNLAIFNMYELEILSQAAIRASLLNSICNGNNLTALKLADEKIKKETTPIMASVVGNNLCSSKYSANEKALFCAYDTNICQKGPHADETVSLVSTKDIRGTFMTELAQISAIANALTNRLQPQRGER